MWFKGSKYTSCAEQKTDGRAAEFVCKWQFRAYLGIIYKLYSPTSYFSFFLLQYMTLKWLCQMPQLLPSLRPHRLDDHLCSTGEREQGPNICYQTQRKQKWHILAPQSLACGQKKGLWFTVSSSKPRLGSEGCRKGQEISIPLTFSLWV